MEKRGRGFGFLESLKANIQNIYLLFILPIIIFKKRISFLLKLFYLLSIYNKIVNMRVLKLFFFFLH